MKPSARWWLTALTVYFLVCITAVLAANKREAKLRQAMLEEAQTYIEIAEGERDNAEESARQWKAMYDLSVAEIAELKAENEELTRRSEELSFALDEVCWETGWTECATFQITHYCSCEICCGKWANGSTATGTEATEGRTVAVDPNVIPLGSEVRIGDHTYIAEDTGVRGHVIDVFVSSHEEALRLGTYKVEVKWRAT